MASVKRHVCICFILAEERVPSRGTVDVDGVSHTLGQIQDLAHQVLNLVGKGMQAIKHNADTDQSPQPGQDTKKVSGLFTPTLQRM